MGEVVGEEWHLRYNVYYKALGDLCFLASLIQEVVSVSVLSSAVYGICWAYSVIGISSPTDSELVKIVYEAGKRHLSVPITKNNL